MNYLQHCLSNFVAASTHGYHWAARARITATQKKVLLLVRVKMFPMQPGVNSDISVPKSEINKDTETETVSKIELQMA